MKRIGIMTFHMADNYGAVLQACGLQNACRLLGYEAGIVDYRPEYISKQYEYFKISTNIRSDMLMILNSVGNYKKKKCFQNFRKNNYTLYDFSQNETLDVVLYGSDQIWNPRVSGDFDPSFFGRIPVKCDRHIAYAASLGITSINSEQKYKLKDLLSNMYAISLRESGSIEILKELAPNNVYSVLDPTLLNDMAYWDKLLLPINTHEKDYIFVYEVAVHKETMRIAEELSKKTGMPIIELTYYKNRPYCRHEQIVGIGPGEFISYIKNAKYVVTSSFHGTAFSIIYRKNFYTIPHKAFGGRMVDLLQMLGLSNRLIRDESVVTAEHIDYAPVEKKLNEQRELSLKFIVDGIK